MNWGVFSDRMGPKSQIACGQQRYLTRTMLAPGHPIIPRFSGSHAEKIKNDLGPASYVEPYTESKFRQVSLRPGPGGDMIIQGAVARTGRSQTNGTHA